MIHTENYRIQQNVQGGRKKPCGLYKLSPRQNIQIMIQLNGHEDYTSNNNKPSENNITQ